MTEKVAFLSISITTISVKLITSAAVPTFGGYSWKCCLADFIADDTTYITNIPALVGRLVLNSKLVANGLAVSLVTSTTVLHAERIHAKFRRVKANCRVETLVAIIARCRVAIGIGGGATIILGSKGVVVLAEVAGRSLGSIDSIAVGLGGVCATTIGSSKRVIVLAEEAGRSLGSIGSIAVGLGVGTAIILGSKRVVVLAEDDSNGNSSFISSSLSIRNLIRERVTARKARIRSVRQSSIRFYHHTMCWHCE
jgi:hypothetical protein